MSFPEGETRRPWRFPASSAPEPTRFSSSRCRTVFCGRPRVAAWLTGTSVIGRCALILCALPDIHELPYAEGSERQ